MKDGKARITVVGSFNMDLVIKAERRPQRGETLVGQSFGMFPGGKGFNQAVAARRLGAEVRMVGKLGRDDFGSRFMRSMAENDIDSKFVFVDEKILTGIGSPVIDAQGDNSIIIVPGANMSLTPEDIETAREAITSADLVMCQLENPVECVLRAAEIAARAGVPVMLNPAPAQPLPAELLRLVTLLTPNETEAQMLSGQGVSDDTSAVIAARALLGLGVKNVVLTLGGRGALLADGQQFLRAGGYTVPVVDTTAAGDGFCAGLAVQYARGRSLQESVSYANAVGALACTVMGATPAMPPAEVVEAFLASHPAPGCYAVNEA